MTRYDLLVIGGGSGGLTAAIMAARMGASVLLVDRESLGGDCLHYGCVPSKALIASARLAHRMRHASRWGLSDVEPRVDIAAVMARIANIQLQIGEGESPEHLAEHGVEVAFGGARFVDAHRVAIGRDREVEADKIIVATGSEAAAPPIPGLMEAGFIDHRSVFSLKTMPARWAVIGGGPIGCELGQALSRLGGEVTIVQRGERLLEREEPQLSEALRRHFAAEGIGVRLGANPQGVERDGDAKVVVIDEADGPRRLVVDELLVAVGRRATIEGLNLEAAGVTVNQRGIVVDERLATSQSHIYAEGDCNGGPQFTHWAEHEARVATRNALFKGTTKRNAQLLPRVTFTDPEVASVGERLAEAQARDGDAHAHTVGFDKVDRAVCESADDGILEVVVDGKDKILGAHAIGHEAGELLAELVLAMKHGISLTEVGDAVHAYPTMSRANRRAADERFFAHGLDSWLARLFANFKPRVG